MDVHKLKLPLLSDELIELEQTHRESLIEKAVADFDNYAFAKVVVS